MFRKVLKIPFLNRIDLSPLVEFPTYTHIRRHSLNLFHYAPKHFSGTPSHSTSEIKHVGVLWKLSCKFLQNRCVIPVQGKLHAARQLCIQIESPNQIQSSSFFVLALKSSLRSTSSMQMSQREMLDLADRCIKSHVITEFPSVYSAPDVKECKSAAGSGVHLCSKFPHSQLLFSTSM